MMIQTIAFIFPHQLFQSTNMLKEVDRVFLIEEFLFFRQYQFHKQKLVLHRASMKAYAHYLYQQGIHANYVDSFDETSDIRVLLSTLDKDSVSELHVYDVCDYWLAKRIREQTEANNWRYVEHTSPGFMLSRQEVGMYFDSKTKWLQHDFYIHQRKRFQLLLDEQGKPLGGQWSFDADNRKKYPTGKQAPKWMNLPTSPWVEEARQYVQTHFPNNPGMLSSNVTYPVTFEESEQWLLDFFEHRFHDFGPYEDAMVTNESVLHHSVLTPMLNIGLLEPARVVHQAIQYAEKHAIPFNSLEGFIRQIIGWREFIRGVYVHGGRKQRTTNFWKFQTSLPTAWYTGNTGLAPVDHVIQHVLQSAYCHHIERLMILSNTMLLCRYHPDLIYQWFMELFIDAYDWVMVPNVYGMGQFADGGLMATKPYISGSAYVLKMSDYKKGAWCEIWDALFWNFMHEQRFFFESNPRLGMLLKTYDKMTEEKKQRMHTIAEDFRATLNALILESSPTD